ncbi:MAG: type IV pilus assembly protein PilM [Candidatus Competibacteraceae bacterium]
MALFKKKQLVLGVDISPSAVKLIELSRAGQRYRVEAIAFEPLPDGSMENRNPIDLDQVSQAIKRAVKASGTHLKQAAVAVPTSSVIIRTIPMPLEFGEDEIEANIQLDASQYIPFPLEEIYLDFQVVPGSAKEAAGTQDIMLVASRQENVELRREVLQEAGLKPLIVDVEAYALENTFRLLPKRLLASQKEEKDSDLGKDAKLIALVDIGATITTVYILRGDKVVFIREQNFGGEQLTLAIAETYGLNRERAELYKKRPTDLPEDYATRILEGFYKATAEQVNQALQFFYSSDHYQTSPVVKLDGLILAGGGAITTVLERALNEYLQIPTALCNPFIRMDHAARINRHILLRDAPLFAVACGLALRSFD